MTFIPKAIQHYAEEHSSSEPRHLVAVCRDTHLHVMKPHMLSGHVVGQLLSIISKLKRPNRILEIGTFTGYASLCLVEGLATDGKLITIDANPELETRTKQNFSNSELGKKIDYRIGDALTLLPTLNERFDLVFIDADKENYKQYYQMVIESVSSGGLIIVDNVLWKGRIVSSDREKKTKAIMAFNDFVKNDSRVEVVMLTVRDGISLIYKK